MKVEISMFLLNQHYFNGDGNMTTTVILLFNFLKGRLSDAVNFFDGIFGTHVE